MKDTIEWDKEYDVVVAGNGGAGNSAAITAYDNGASVIILEKSPAPGGGQTRTAGVGSAFAINPEKAAEYLFAASSNGLEDADPASRVSVTPEKDCLIFMKELANNPAWLTSMGVEHSVSKGRPTSYKAFPGADAFGQISIKGFGIQFLTTMKTQLEKRGIEVLFETPATELIQDAENREIIGVYVLNHSKKIAIKARKGVILCTGGFEFDEEMKANYLRPFPLKFSGWPYNTGDGIKMAQKVGADLWHMNTIVGYLNIWVPEYKAAWLLHFYHGIWVNKYGKRYTNEGIKFTHNWWLKNFDFNLDEPGYSSIPTYLIFDENIRKQRAVAGVSASDPHGRRGLQTYPSDMGGYPEGWSQDNQLEIDKGWIKKAGSIEELGKTIGGKMDPQALATTVSNYNRYCEQKNDPEFGRPVELLEPLVTPPFYACALYPGGINTCGGPRRNAYGQVLDPYKKIIPRLYTAGEMGSICGNIYALGGLNAGEMLASGRLAGKNAAGLSNWI